MPDNLTLTASEVESFKKMLACKHKNRSGGNDYLACHDCGLEWDYRRETAESRLRTDIEPHLPALLRAWESLRHVQSADGTRRRCDHLWTDGPARCSASRRASRITLQDHHEEQLMKTDPATIERLRELHNKAIGRMADEGDIVELRVCTHRNLASLLSDASRVQELERQLAVAVGALVKIRTGKTHEDNEHPLGEYASQSIRYHNIARSAIAQIEGEKK